MVYKSIADNETARRAAEIWNSDFKDLRKGSFIVSGGNSDIFIDDCLDASGMYFDSKETSEYFEKIFKPLNLKIRYWSVTFIKKNKINIRVVLDKI
jgi:hypothetical protein